MKLFRSLYFWILIAFVGGCILGFVDPSLAVLMGPLGTNFIKLVKVFIGPLVFFTVITGIIQAGTLKKLGNTGFKALIYFEIVSTIALLIGWASALILQPGASVHAKVELLDKSAVSSYLHSAANLTVSGYLQHFIPTTIIEPFANGDMLQILLIAIIFGIALLALDNTRASPLVGMLEQLTQGLFQVIRLIMYAAPIGVFGAIAYTVGKFGGHLLIPLLGLIGSFYIAGFIFIFIILGTLAKAAGFSIIRFLKYIMPELLLVFGTSSSESALPQLLAKLEKLGCHRETTGIVVPFGYSFNLDGTNIYITLAALFIAQALGIQLTFMQELTLFITAMLTSKGAAGIPGSGFITLAATLAVLPIIPAIGIVLILGIDRFMSDARSIVNYIGIGVAALVISRWEGDISAKALKENINSISRQ